MNIFPKAQQQIPLIWNCTTYGILKHFWNHYATRLALHLGDRDSIPHYEIHIGSGDTQLHAQMLPDLFPRAKECKI